MVVTVMASDDPLPLPPSRRLSLAAHQPSKRHHAQSLLDPHFMTQERLMFSNSTLSKPRLCPAVTMSDDMLSAPTPPLHCASVL